MTFESFLRQPFSNEELMAIAGLENEINREQARVAALPADVIALGADRMSVLRLTASSSLQRGDHAGWLEANTFIHKQIQNGETPDWRALQQMNHFFTNQGGRVRQQKIYIGHFQACPYDELENTLAFFKENILPQPNIYSALTHAALCQYWLVSIHPFLDGNGRTSVLLSDWLLVKNDYLPQSFSSKIDAIVMYVPGRVKKMTPGMSVAKILQNVLRSYRCFAERCN